MARRSAKGAKRRIGNGEGTTKRSERESFLRLDVSELLFPHWNLVAELRAGDERLGL